MMIRPLKPSKNSFPGALASYRIQIPSACFSSTSTANGCAQPAKFTTEIVFWTGSATTMWIPKETSNMTSTASTTKGLKTASGRTGGGNGSKRAGHYVVRGWSVDYRRLSQVDSLQVGIADISTGRIYLSPAGFAGFPGAFRSIKSATAHRMGMRI